MSEIIWVDNDTAAPVGSNPTPTGSNRPGALWATGHALWVTQGAFIGQPNSAAAGYAKTVPFSGLGQHRLHATTAVNLSGATIGTAGVIGDTVITGIYVSAACTVTLTGFFQDETLANQTLAVVMAAAGIVPLPINGLINLFAPAQITCSVADVCYVTHGAP